MDFKNIFISYCIKIRSANLNMTSEEQPDYREILLILLLGSSMLQISYIFSKNTTFYNILMGISILLLLRLIYMDSTPIGLKKLQPYYKRKSQKRREIILEVLNEYKIDLLDKEKINILIKESKKNQSKYFFINKNYFDKIALVLIGEGIKVGQEIFSNIDNLSQFLQTDKLLVLVLGVILIMIINLFVEFIFFPNNKYYSYLTYDLEQLLIFDKKINL